MDNRSVVVDMILVDNGHIVTITMVGHIGRHTRIVVAIGFGSRVRIGRRIVIPVVRRTPRIVAIRTQAGIDKRSAGEHRLNDILGTIDVGGTNHLYIASTIGRNISNNSSYILIYIVGQNSLNQEYVVVSTNSLQYTQIVDIAIAIEVEVGEHNG